jgi:type I restriction enzyme S subunit
MGEMFGFEFISDQDMSRVALSAKELSVSGLQDGDLLFGRRSVVPAGAGKCSLIVAPSEPITFESSIIRVRLDRTQALPLFFYYFFASPAGRSVIGSIVAGTNIKGIRATELRELNVPLPSKGEQEAIAEALSDADALIDSLEQLIAKKRHIKEGAQELLTGKKRLPGFAKTTLYKQTELGVIPEDWAISTLESVAHIIDPQPDHRTPPEATGGEPYIGISDFIDNHTVDWEPDSEPTFIQSLSYTFVNLFPLFRFGHPVFSGIPWHYSATMVQYCHARRNVTGSCAIVNERLALKRRRIND